MIWNDQYNRYLAALEKARRELPEEDRTTWEYWGWGFWTAELFTAKYVQELLNSNPEIIPNFSNASNEVVQWFIESLKDERRKWFALGILAQVQTLPDLFLPVLVHAAVQETNLSLTEHFIGTAYQLSHRQVVERLLEYAEHGTDLEQKIALHAFHWVIKYTNWTSKEGPELLAVFETAATNPQYSEMVREHARRYCDEVKCCIENDT